MPYKDKEAQRDAVREAMRRKRGITSDGGQGITKEGITTEKVSQGITDVIPDVIPDWANRANYPACYLAALDAQGGKLTEASRVAMTGHQVDEEIRLAFIRRHGMITGKPFQGVHSEPVELERVAGVTDYPPLLYAMADTKRRARLRRICDNLKAHQYVDLFGEKRNYLGQVRYGLSGPTFDTVDQCLEVLA